MTVDVVETIAVVRLEVKNWSGKLAGESARMSDIFTLLKLLQEAEHEVQRLTQRRDRFHDVAVQYRRAARVFLKPAFTLADRNAFLDGLRTDSRAADKLDAVALAPRLHSVERNRGPLDGALAGRRNAAGFR